MRRGGRLPGLGDSPGRLEELIKDLRGNRVHLRDGEVLERLQASSVETHECTARSSSRIFFLTILGMEEALEDARM